VSVLRVVLPTCRFTPALDGPSAALYVIVAAHGRLAKVGALESADNVQRRLRRVERDHRTRDDDPEAHPLRVVLVGEIEGLVVGGYRWVDDGWVYDGGKAGFDQRWAEVEHLESAVRLGVARRVGRVARWADWIEVDRPSMTDTAWLSAFQSSWLEVDQLGGSA
jgi:hypothetical protein